MKVGGVERRRITEGIGWTNNLGARYGSTVWENGMGERYGSTVWELVWELVREHGNGVVV